MATLTEYLNAKIKAKGSTLSKEKAKAKKYKSISAAKKAGALYYTNKAGKVMAAVFAEDLKKPIKKANPRPKTRPDTVERVGLGYGDMTKAELTEVKLRNKEIRKQEKERYDKRLKEALDAVGITDTTRKKRGVPLKGIDPLKLANPKPEPEKKKPAKKKSNIK